MKIAFCGGAGEVGASCVLLCLGEKNIVFDCGVRPNSPTGSLPNLKLIQDSGGADAIFLSHAHLDHSGSLPILSAAYPMAGIYMTHATKDLIRVLLYDSLKITSFKEEEIPVFTEEQLESMFKRIICHSPEYVFNPFNDELSAVFYTAGHVLGAAGIYLSGKDGSVFYSGDFSMAKQRTVEKARFPKLKPDAAIVESTYGDKLHSSRLDEEKMLIDKVREVVESGKKILIPAFALGRAQEVILILRNAAAKGMLPDVKIYVDGMVNDICRAYSNNPNYLSQMLSRRVFRHNEIFYSKNVIAVNRDMKTREAIVNSNEACCIISSSGMLTGGPSQFYAERLAGDEGNYIAITGYQDEESPGRRLLNLLDREKGTKMLAFGDKSFEVKCGIGKYNLSAHADKYEIISLVNHIAPKRVFFVHGDEKVIQALSLETQSGIKEPVFAPSNGESFEIGGKSKLRKHSTNMPDSINEIFELSEDLLKKLSVHLAVSGFESRDFTIEDLLFAAFGRREFTEDETALFLNAVNASVYFKRNKVKQFLYNISELAAWLALSAKANGTLPQGPEIPPEKLQGEMPAKVHRVNQAEILQAVEESFPLDSGLYRKGLREDTRTILLYFNFPAVASERYKDTLIRLAERTGWEVKVNSEVNLEAVKSTAASLIPEFTKLSYMKDLGEIRLKTEGVIEDKREIISRFKELTGLELNIMDTSRPAVPVFNPEADNTPSPLPEGDSRMPNGEKMEQNTALWLIDEAFKETEDRIYRKSIKTEGTGKFIELFFISPVIGNKYKSVISGLERATAWQIRCSSAINQFEVINAGRRIFEETGIKLTKNMSLHTSELRAEIFINPGYDPQWLEEASSKFTKATGLEVTIRKK